MRLLGSPLTIFLTVQFVFSPLAADAGGGFCQAESDQLAPRWRRTSMTAFGPLPSGGYVRGSGSRQLA